MCPIDTFCFDKTTFIIIIVGCIVFIAHYIGEVSNKVSILEKNIEKNDDKMNSKITKYRTTGDKTGKRDGIIISFIAALVNKSTNLP